MIVLGNVIFPAFTAPYMCAMFFPIAGGAALAAEVGVFRWFNPGAGLLRLTGVVLLANLASSICGIVLGMVLPSGLVPMPRNGILTTGPTWKIYAICGFFVALVVSILIEYRVLSCFQKRFQFQKLLKCVLVANVASYAVLVIMAIASAVFGLYWV